MAEEYSPPGYANQPDYARQEQQHKHHEHLAGLGTAAAGAYALDERHEKKKDPEQAHKHKLEEQMGGAAAAGAGGYGIYEHHEKRNDKKEEKESGGKKHHLF